MSDITTTIDTYLALLNEPDPARRAALLPRVWAGDGRFHSVAGFVDVAPAPAA